MYLTENHLCFFRNLIGFQKKIKIMWTDIQQIELKKAEFLVHSTKHKDSLLTYSGFSDFQTSYKFVQKLWNAACGVDSDANYSEEEEESKPEQKVQEELKPVAPALSPPKTPK